MSTLRLKSPLLGNEIYDQDAVEAVLGALADHQRQAISLHMRPEGWLLTMSASPHEALQSERALWAILNDILATSLETRLEATSP